MSVNVMRISGTCSNVPSVITEMLLATSAAVGHKPAPATMISAARRREHAFLDVVHEYVGAGFDHIIPKGLDHILFVLGIFFGFYPALHSTRADLVTILNSIDHDTPGWKAVSADTARAMRFRVDTGTQEERAAEHVPRAVVDQPREIRGIGGIAEIELQHTRALGRAVVARID